MAASGAKRKLTAVFVTDVAGYSRLMNDNPDATLVTLAEYREVFSAHIEKFQGRVVNAPGDSILAEFDSVVDAVDSAVEIQGELAVRNRELPDDRRMDFRIGVNLGDVLVKEGELFGDGVNIAARLESLAEPGGICISRPVYDQIKSRSKLEWEYMGEQLVKNIPEPVRAYRLVSIPEGGDAREQDSCGTVPQQELTMDLPDKPSIAVLPFDTMSNDKEQMYFADGFVEDIITELSKFRWFDVIARNSSFTYQDKKVDVRQVSRELGVHYVMEGSVRNISDRVRINAQLIDAVSGNHIWAERFDSPLESLFDLQDDIVSRIAGSLQPELYSAEVTRAKRKNQENLDVWNYAVRGRWHVTRLTREDNAEALRLIEKALELDPDHALSLAFLAYCHLTALFFGFSQTPPESISKASEAAAKAMALEENNPWVQCAMGLTLFIGKEPDRAIAHFRKAIDLNPNFAIAYGYQSLVKAHAGLPGEAIEAGKKAVRLSPHDPEMIHFSIGLGTACFISGDLEEALLWARKAIEVRPDAPAGHRLLAATLALMDRVEDAKQAVEGLLALKPNMTVTAVRNTIHFKHPGDSDLYAENLLKAGLPE